MIHVITKAPQQRRFFMKGGYEFGGPDSAYGSFVYHDKLTNGFGISVGYRYEQSSGFEDTRVVKSPTAGAPGTNRVSGWTRTTTTTGAPAYLIGDIGKQPWNYHSTQARLFDDFSADSRVNAGISYFRSDVDIDDPNTYLRDGAGLPVTTGILDIDGRRISITPRDFVANGPAHDDVLRTFANWDHAFTEDVRLQVGVSYAEDRRAHV